MVFSQFKDIQVSHVGHKTMRCTGAFSIPINCRVKLSKRKQHFLKHNGVGKWMMAVGKWIMDQQCNEWPASVTILAVWTLSGQEYQASSRTWGDIRSSTFLVDGWRLVELSFIFVFVHLPLVFRLTEFGRGSVYVITASLKRGSTPALFWGVCRTRG